ncbi:MAG: hypothetical protein CBD88_07475 [Flavobacteriales bacterium TMED228]|jgi:hypothetical protein|nr:MAG: hypothetical protein CBD88_07475 [Flavobacteriales bacterium TMED228]|tara:strand:- start:490 stop:669 length:180 start_codon:yes stop_codon:yes gene_type:complete
MADMEERVSALEKEMASLQTEVRIQFKELFTRVKRVEAIMIGASAAIIMMLITVLTKMG